MKTLDFRVEAVIFNQENELLLALHRKQEKSYWVLPGGHLEFGESMDSGLRRELLEELGLEYPAVQELEFLDEFIDPDGSRHVIKAGFLVELKPHELENIRVVAEDESIKEAQFFSIHKIENSLDVFYPSKEFFLDLLETMSGKE